MNIEYDVFISYSRKDYVDENNNVIPGNVVSKIKEALTNAGISYWFDEEGLYSGQNCAEKIINVIESSKILIFLSTANANNSRWTIKEIASADLLNKPIIPVRIDNTPYDNKILFRISELDYIEYYSNPEKSLRSLIAIIKSNLSLNSDEGHSQENVNVTKAIEGQNGEKYKQKVQSSQPITSIKKDKAFARKLFQNVPDKRLSKHKSKILITCLILISGIFIGRFFSKVLYPKLANKCVSASDSITIMEPQINQDTVPEIDKIIHTTGKSEIAVTSIAEEQLTKHENSGQVVSNVNEHKESIVETDAEAFKRYLKAAEEWDAEAQYKLADCYYYGKGTVKNKKEALKWYKNAADTGNAKAQNKLGTLYFDGDGVPKDYSQAVAWFEKSAKQGNTDAMYNLGNRYRNGEGVEQNNNKAIEWYQIAAKHGNFAAKERLKDLSNK